MPPGQRSALPAQTKGEAMGIITALAVVIGIMGGLATTVWLELASVYWVIWVTFVGWASFYAAGGGTEGITKSVAANVWGVLIATVSLFAFTKLTGIRPSIAAGLCVGIAIIILILAAYLPALGFIPGQVFGYAPTAGLFLSGVYVTEAGASDPVKLFLAAAISLIIGNVLGIVSEKIGGAVAKS